LTTQLKHNIVISPIGNIDTKLIKPISREIKKIFNYQTCETPLLKDVDFAFDPSRHQYHSTLILNKLESQAPPDSTKIVALTDLDLFIPILTYVYGEAQLGGKACIVSTHRLMEGLSSKSSPETFRIRVIKEAIHELGHTFSLKHCPDHTCIMHYCRAIEDVDIKSDSLCRYCTILLDDEKKRLSP